MAQPAVPVGGYTAAKSPGVAALLSFLWLGAGHLYVGRTSAGAGLVLLNFFLIIISFTGIGMIVSIPVWCVVVVIAMITSANAAKEPSGQAAYGSPSVLPPGSVPPSPGFPPR